MPLGGDLGDFHPTVLESQHDGLLQEGGSHQSPVDAVCLLGRDPVLENDAPLPAFRLVVRGGLLQEVLEPVHQLGQVVSGQ